MATSDRSFSDILQDVVHNVQEIIRSEVRLAKAEIQEQAVKAKSAGLLVGTGAVCGILAALFFLFGIVYALERLMPNWAAAFIVAAIIGVAAILMANAGVKRFRQVRPTPEKTIESLKENVGWAKQQTR